jgi:hypothetical protein
MAAITLLVLATESIEKNSHELTRMGQPPNNLIADSAFGGQVAQIPPDGVADKWHGVY